MGIVSESNILSNRDYYVKPKNSKATSIYILFPSQKVIEQLTLKVDARSNIMTAQEKYDSSVAKVSYW